MGKVTWRLKGSVKNGVAVAKATGKGALMALAMAAVKVLVMGRGMHWQLPFEVA
jgi:hypothetical protein